ncbi:MAG: alpha/beta hydrolase [Gemmatirosa sp.]
MRQERAAPGAESAHVETPRTARYWHAGAPDAREVWIALHGYGQLAEYFVRHFVPFAGERRLVVAPEALSRFYVGADENGSHGAMRVGATWMTREDRLSEIADYVRWLDAALDAATGGFDASRARLNVLAFSQGTATACRWLLHRRRAGHASAARLVLWGGELPHDLDLAQDGALLRDTPLTLVVGEEDAFATPASVAQQRARLDAARIPHALVSYAGGHRIERETLARVLAGDA